MALTFANNACTKSYELHEQRNVFYEQILLHGIKVSLTRKQIYALRLFALRVYIRTLGLGN